MMKNFICINCPMGCRLTVHLSGEDVSKVEGHLCQRGKEYALQEVICPKRVLTSLMMPANRRKPLSVKTTSSIPKKQFFDCVRQILHTRPLAPLTCGEVVIHNICGTGADVVVTRDIK